MSCHSVQNRYFGGHQARQSPTVTCTAIPRGQAVNLSSDLLPFLALLSLSIRTPRQKYEGGKFALPFSLTSQTNCSVKHVTSWLPASLHRQYHRFGLASLGFSLAITVCHRHTLIHSYPPEGCLPKSEPPIPMNTPSGVLNLPH